MIKDAQRLERTPKEVGQLYVQSELEPCVDREALKQRVPTLNVDRLTDRELAQIQDQIAKLHDRARRNLRLGEVHP